MKKKIAVFATGWSPEILEKYTRGLYNSLSEIGADIYMFLNYALTTDMEDVIKGELNIFNLPNLNDFDGAVILGNGMDFDGLCESIIERCNKSSVPVICTGRKPDDNSIFVGSDNIVGAKELYEHVVKDHKCHDIVFIAGAFDNPDSATRLKVLRSVLAREGIELPENRVCYTNWSPVVGANFVKDWILAGRKMPDAIICANDVLAIAVCSALDDAGYSAPADTLVTGFDHESSSDIFTPSISTVDQSFEDIGKASGKALTDIFNGCEVPKKILVPSKMVKAASCGCIDCVKEERLRREFCTEYYFKNSASSVFNISMENLERTVMNGTSYEELATSIQKYMERGHRFEGNTFHIILDSAYAKSIDNIDTEFKVEGYSEDMNVVISLEDGEIVTNRKFKSRKLIPQLSKRNFNNRFFIFLPIHEFEKCFGYLIFGDDISKLGNLTHLYGYITRICVLLEMYRKTLSINVLNSQLIELNAKDALTHVKNRSAYIDMEMKIDKEMKKDRDYQFAIAMFDINNLKLVNDEYGHEIGDQYIVGACQMICSIFKCSPVYRIGGDEFVVVLCGSDYSARESLLDELQKLMKSLKTKDIPIYEKYSVASGLAVYNPQYDKAVSDVFTRADEAMYTNKQIMKGKGEVRNNPYK